MGVFKDCDIRGVYGKELTGEISYKIGLAVGTIIGGKTIVVSGDIRNSTPELKESLIRGLVQAGAQVLDIGMNPTPVFYYAKKHLGAYAGAQVTASHNPPEYNGFKFMLGELPVQSKDILEIQTVMENGTFANARGSIEIIDGIWDTYQRQADHMTGEMRGRVVVDAGNGAVSELMPRMFASKGMDVIPLFCEYDGNFSGRDPNPAVYAHLTELQKQVVASKADFGAAFDGDGDRVVFVDDLGRVVMSEQSFVILIREYLKIKPGGVVYDLKSSSIVRSEVKKLGGTPIMERSGHAFIKRTMLQKKAALAGEISGHFFFGELGYDDGMYAAMKMAEILNKSGQKLSRIVDAIPKTLITPDIRIPVLYDRQEAILKGLRALGKKYSLSEMDGVRVEFPFGWLLVRKSVTEQAMTVRIEAGDEQGMEEIKDLLKEYAPDLAQSIG